MLGVSVVLHDEAWRTLWAANRTRSQPKLHRQFLTIASSNSSTTTSFNADLRNSNSATAEVQVWTVENCGFSARAKAVPLRKR
jgi:hypothetical protein